MYMELHEENNLLNENLQEEIIADEKEEQVATDLPQEEKNSSANFSYIYDMTLEELTSELESCAHTDIVIEKRTLIELIRSDFYKKLRIDTDTQYKEFIAEGGEAADFVYNKDLEEKFKNIYTRIKELRAEIQQKIEAEKQRNLTLRIEIIEALKELVTTQESLGKTFQDFKDLQDKWKSIGEIPASEVKKTWEQYNLQIGIFYNYVKINKELRDLDLRKNLEAKLELCEKAEQLLLEPSITKAFSQLQDLHKLWSETGPVVEDKKEDIWNRFKETTNIINKKHQAHFETIREEEKLNYEKKTELCLLVEELIAQDIQSIKEWNKTTEIIVNLQKEWKTIGFATKKYNTSVYERFCKATDLFFERKKIFFAQLKEEEDENKAKRIALCEQAEEMANRTDWNQASNDFIQLQEKWKETGPVSFKDTTKLWNRFRAACDTFFNARQEFYKSKDSEQNENLTIKKEIAEAVKILATNDTNTKEETLQELQNLQKKWTDTGHVPAKKKDALHKEYTTNIQLVYEKLSLSAEEKSTIMMQTKLHTILNEQAAPQKVKQEIIKLQNKIRTIESDILQLENNIGFFAKSKKSELLIKDFDKKIEKGRKEIETIKEQIKVMKSITEKK